MPDFIKHVGRNKNGTRLVVVFREIPDDESFCLCVETDSLPDMYHDQLLHEVNSRDAQATVDLFEVLQRRSFGDGGQILNTLHSRGMLRKYAVEDITMMPMPNRPVPLAFVNEQIKTGTIASENKETVVDVKEKKIDHPPKGSKDAVDTVCQITSYIRRNEEKFQTDRNRGLTAKNRPSIGLFKVRGF